MSQGMNAARWRWALVLAGLLLAWGLPELGLPTMLFPGTALAARGVGRELIWWAFGFVMLLWVTLVEKQPLSSINLRQPGFGTLGSIMLRCAHDRKRDAELRTDFPGARATPELATTRSLTEVPLWLQTATMVRAGVVKEILYPWLSNRTHHGLDRLPLARGGARGIRVHRRTRRRIGVSATDRRHLWRSDHHVPLPLAARLGRLHDRARVHPHHRVRAGAGADVKHKPRG